MSPPADTDFAARARYVVMLAAATTLVIVVAWLAFDVVLVVFAGLLFAVLFASPSQWLARRTRLPYGACLVAVLAAAVAVFVGAGLLAAPALSEQLDRLVVDVPAAARTLAERLRDTTWGERLAEAADVEAALPEAPAVFRSLGVVFSAASGAVAGVVVVLFIGLYVAGSPGLYRKGLLVAVPPRNRARVATLLDDAVTTLRGWLLGTLLSMTVIGVGTTLGLWWLGVPLAPILGLLAALLTFIPNIGPVVAAVPAVLIGLAESPSRALSILILYTAIQFVESYVITPLVQRRTVRMPPAVALASQLLLGSLAGLLGVALATPLAAVAIAVVKRVREPER